MSLSRSDLEVAQRWLAADPPKPTDFPCMGLARLVQRQIDIGVFDADGVQVKARWFGDSR